MKLALVITAALASPALADRSLEPDYAHARHVTTVRQLIDWAAGLTGKSFVIPSEALRCTLSPLRVPNDLSPRDAENVLAAALSTLGMRTVATGNVVLIPDPSPRRHIRPRLPYYDCAAFRVSP